VHVDWFVNFLRTGGAYPVWITLSRKLTRQVQLIDVLEVVGHVLHESRARLIRLSNFCSVRMTSHSRTKVSDESLAKQACLGLRFTRSLKWTCRWNVWNEHGHKNSCQQSSFLARCRKLLRLYPPEMVQMIWFTNEKLFSVAAPSNRQNDHCNVESSKKKEKSWRCSFTAHTTNIQQVVDGLCRGVVSWVHWCPLLGAWRRGQWIILQRRHPEADVVAWH